MVGNVWEWVQDCNLMPYPADAPKLPSGPGCGAVLALGPVLLASLIAAALRGGQQSHCPCHRSSFAFVSLCSS